MTPTVSAVIPNWNKADLLAHVLADLRLQTHPVERTVVVDNASTDASVEVAKRAGVTLVRLADNQGFARAVNRGIAECSSEWVLILNNDVRFGPEWLSALMKAATDSGAWFAVGKLQSGVNHRIIDGTYDAISRAATAWRCGQGKMDGELWSAPLKIGMAPLTAALLRRELFERVGMLDESFESYLEDVDFGLRCVAKKCMGVYNPGAVAEHTGSATLGPWHKATVRRLARNQVLLVRKHFAGAPWWPILAGQLLWGLVAAKHGAGAAWARGKWEGLRMKGVERSSEWTQIAPFVVVSEAEIRRLQQAAGFDLYWRLYFALVRN